MSSNCAGRFPELCVCKTEYPAISNYDYETNYATRGIDNRNFRWQDIFVEANYLFLGVIESGTFENNSFASIAGVTGSTGLWPITTGNVTQNTAYAPWNVYGGYTYYIPTSGIRASYDNLPSYTQVNIPNQPRFWVPPLEGNQSIGLFCWSRYLPTIYSSPLQVSPTGVDNNGTYQVYLQAKTNFCIYPSGYPGVMPPRLKVYIEAKTGSSTIGYYDPILNIWKVSEPVSWYRVPSDRITEIKFDFAPSGEVPALPDKYVLWVKTDSTGSFITIDEIHVDQYMETNPYTTGFVPDSYMLQISPDLGWSNKELMLSQKTGNLNPFVRTYGPFTTSEGNLVDNLDGSVSATLSLLDFEKVINKKYNKYVWRAYATSPNGEMSMSSYPQSFEFVGFVLDKDFSITEIVDNPQTLSKTIIGTRGPRLSILVDGKENYPGLEYPTKTSWKVTIEVLSEKQLVKILARDDGGATSKLQYVELTNKLYKPTNELLWNTFDDHGLLMDIRRIPGESNIDYYNRIRDVNRSPAGSNFFGLANSSNRELGLSKIDQAIILSIPKNIYDKNIHNTVFIDFDSTVFRVRTSSMQYKERVYLDPIYKTLELSKRAVEIPYRAISDNGIEIPTSKLEFDLDEDTPSVCRIKIDYPSVLGTYINIEYEYIEEVHYKQYPTLGQLVDKIKTLRDELGQPIVNASLNMKLAGGEDCLGLFIDNAEISNNTAFSITWSKLKIRRISDKQYREYFSRERYSYKDTKFYTYINELRSNSRTLWGTVEADRDFWDAADSTNRSFDHLPTTFDPIIYEYVTSSGLSSSRKLDSAEAWARQYIGNFGEDIQNNGIPQELFQAGVAHTNDLAPSIHVQQTKIVFTDSLRTIISDVRQNNNLIIFSGNR